MLDSVNTKCWSLFDNVHVQVTKLQTRDEKWHMTSSIPLTRLVSTMYYRCRLHLTLKPYTKTIQVSERHKYGNSSWEERTQPLEGRGGGCTHQYFGWRCAANKTILDQIAWINSLTFSRFQSHNGTLWSTEFLWKLNILFAVESDRCILYWLT